MSFLLRMRGKRSSYDQWFCSYKKAYFWRFLCSEWLNWANSFRIVLGFPRDNGLDRTIFKIHFFKIDRLWGTHKTHFWEKSKSFYWSLLHNTPPGKSLAVKFMKPFGNLAHPNGHTLFSYWSPTFLMIVTHFRKDVYTPLWGWLPTLPRMVTNMEH